MLNLLIIIASSISVSLLFLGYIILKKREKNFTNVSFSLFSFLGAFWVMVNFLANLVSEMKVAEAFLRLDFLIASLLIFCAFVFLFNFPFENKKFNRLIPFFIIPTIFISLFSFSKLLLYDVQLVDSGITFKEGPFFLFYSLILIANVLSGLVNQILQYRKLKGVARMQVKYVLIAFVVVVLLAAFNLSMQNKVSVNTFRLINFSPVILFVSIFYAIVKYRLLNVHYVLRLSTIFAFLLALVAGAYISLTYLITDLLGASGVWAYAAPSFLIVAFFDKLKKTIAGVSDKYLFQKQYEFSDIAKQIEKAIRSSSSLNLSNSIDSIVTILNSALKVSSTAVYVKADNGSFISYYQHGSFKKEAAIEKGSILLRYFDKYNNDIIDKEEFLSGKKDLRDNSISQEEIINEMEKNGFYIMSPILFEKNILGFIAFDEKLSKDYFSDEDLSLIRHVVWQLGFIINNYNIYNSLRKIDIEKSRLISVISHQFRGPLTSNRFNLELAMDTDVKEEQKNESLQEAYKSNLTINKYLDQLLLVLEIENTGFSVREDLIFPDEIIEKALNKYKKHIKEKNIEIKKEIFDRNFLFKTDREKISKVFEILVSNAIKYSYNNGEVLINVSKEYLKGSDYLKFSIYDFGIGIDDESMDNISKKFFRSKQALSVSPDGFGLNLFIAKKIIEANGGELGFEKNKDKGSLFYFYLPA